MRKRLAGLLRATANLIDPPEVARSPWVFAGWTGLPSSGTDVRVTWLNEN